MVLLLPRNEARRPPAGLDDVTRPLIYPKLDFDEGGISILSASIDGRRVNGHGDPESTVVEIALPGPVSASKPTKIVVEFETVVPERYGAFGRVDGQATLTGGWVPALAGIGADGAWETSRFESSTFDVSLRLPEGHSAVLGGRLVPGGEGFARLRFSESLPLPLAVAPDFRIERHRSGSGVEFGVVRRPRKLTTRIGPPPSLDSRLPDAVARILDAAPPEIREEPLLVVESPLRADLAVPAGGHVLVSDRALRVHEVLLPFHETALAEAVFRELLSRREAAGEGTDRFWVEEGAAAVLARRFAEREHARARSVDDWIRMFDLFAVVDRFERAPQIPFVDAFFQRSTRPVTAPLDPGPPRVSGRIVFDKLENALGREAVERMADAVASGCAPFRVCAARIAGRPVGPIADPWIGPWPSVDHGIAGVDLNAPADGGWKHEITIERRADREVIETVPVVVEECDGGRTRLRWRGIDDVETVVARTDSPACRVVVDPERILIDESRHDNATPPAWELVLDTADVEVSSTEFGLAGLAVLRRQQDIRRDIGIAGFFTNRSLGTTWGPRLHFGRRLDRALFANELYLFGGVELLSGDFVDERFPDRRTDGITTSLGVRFERTNVYAFDNPTRARRARLFLDWHTRGLGGDYDFLSGGVALSGTHPLGSRRTIGAVEVLNGFLTGSKIPNQGLFSLGGARSIRGIGAEEELGKNLLLARAEIRQELPISFDASLFDALVARGGQLRAFVDTGRVDDDASRIYEPDDWAVGVGVGFTLVYEFLGFFPSRAFIDVATRVDEGSPASNVQFLFGTRQPF